MMDGRNALSSQVYIWFFIAADRRTTIKQNLVSVFTSASIASVPKGGHKLTRKETYLSDIESASSTTSSTSDLK